MAWASTRKSWWFSTLLIALLICIPFLFILINVFSPASEAWQHITTTLLPNYITNTIILCLSVGALTFVLGVGCAWLVTFYEFPLRRILSPGLYLPLAIPAYILAFTYSGLFDFTGAYQSTIRALFSEETARAMYFDVMQMKWLVVLLSLAFYPYVYATTRASFQLQSNSLLDTAKSHGYRGFKLLTKVSLPLARVAIAGGLFLVLMETLNDYGAMKYFGIQSFTTGIFKAWFSLGDLSAAIKLSGVLIVFVILIVGAQRLSTRNAQYAISGNAQPLRRIRLTGLSATAASLFCLLPFLFGFLVPVVQLLFWFAKYASTIITADFAMLLLNSVAVALAASAIILVVATLLIFSARINQGKGNGILRQIAISGYAVPGAIIAVGVLVAAMGLERSVNELTGIGFLLSGTILLLLFAYLVRYFAVGHNPIDGGFVRNGRHLEEASLSLGKSPWQTLMQVHIPVLKPALAGAFILSFVDVMKELPLTLILRPANFDTLATKAFELANDEMLQHAATPAVILIAISAIPVIVLGKGQKI